MEPTTGTSDATAEITKAKEFNGLTAFNMRSLSGHLPHKRKGLSKYFSGKSRSFAHLADAKCVEDLEKAEQIPEAKRRKYSERQETALIPAFSCREESSSDSYCSSCVGV